MEYMPSVLSQAVCFVYSAGLGFCFGLLYDFLRIIFYLFTGNDKKLSCVRDIIYMLFCLGVHFIFILVMCSGRIMMFTFAGEIIGLFSYFKTLSRQIYIPVKKLFTGFRCSVKRIIEFLKKFVYKSYSLFQNIPKKVKKSEKILRKDLQIRHNVLYNLSVPLCSERDKSKNRGDEYGKRKDA